MKHKFLFLMYLLLCSSLFGQSPRRLAPTNDKSVTNALPMVAKLPIVEPTNNSSTSGSEYPIGTSLTDAVSSIKIGESSNAYTAVAEEMSQLSVQSKIGQNGGSIGFIYRQNVLNCGGSTDENGVYRYSFSTDGGLSWEVGSGQNSGGNIPVTGCYGLGPLNPAYLQASRYPNAQLFLPPDSSNSFDNLGLIYAGPVLAPSGNGWDGIVYGTVDSAASNMPVTRSEEYLGGNSGSYFAYSLIERIPGEFFFLSYSTDNGNTATGDVLVHRGIWNPGTQQADWSVVTTIEPDYFLGFDGGPRFGSLSLAFGPDGTVGYIAGTGDLVGGVDTALTVWFSRSADGGMTWGEPYAFDLRSKEDLMDSLHFWQELYPIIDPVTGDSIGVDTTFAGGNSPTVVFSLDLVVDKDNVPHAIATVGHGSIHNGDGTYSDPNYSIWSGVNLESLVLDFTLDQFGDPNILYLSAQNFLFGQTGDDAVDPAGEFTVTPFVQASRSSDGEVILFSWTDSDSSTVTSHESPNLFTMGYDIVSGLTTTVVDRTSDDGIWNTNVLTPHAANESIFDGNCTYTMPIVGMNLDGTDALQTVSHWYFSDVQFDRCNDFTETPQYFYNCKENPFSNTFTLTQPNCLANNGEIVLNPVGGVGPYSFQSTWNTGTSIEDTLTNLAHGIYNVVISDSKGCADTLTIILNNQGTVDATIDSVQDISCFGLNDGQATITLTGATGNELIVWPGGENTPTAVNLPPGDLSVLVLDTVSGCAAYFPIQLSEPPAIESQAMATDVLCFGDSTAQLSATASGGTGMLQFEWSSGEMGEIQTNVSAGNYSVVITDENGCKDTTFTSVQQPPELVSSLLGFPNTTASPPYNGNIVTNVNGGVEPYSYQYSSMFGFDTSGVGLDFLTALCGTDYYLELTDQNGCVLRDTIEVGIVGDGVLCESTESIGETVGVLSFELSPNPTHKTCWIKVELEKPEEFTLRIMDTRGKILEQNIGIFASQYQYRFSVDHIPAGVYLVGLTTSTGGVVKKLIVW